MKVVNKKVLIKSKGRVMPKSFFSLVFNPFSLLAFFCLLPAWSQPVDSLEMKAEPREASMNSDSTASDSLVGSSSTQPEAAPVAGKDSTVNLPANEAAGGPLDSAALPAPVIPGNAAPLVSPVESVSKPDTGAAANSKPPKAPLKTSSPPLPKPVLNDEDDDEDSGEPVVMPYKPLQLYFFLGSCHELGDWGDPKGLGYNIGVLGFYRLNKYFAVGGGVGVNNWRLNITDDPLLSTRQIEGLVQVASGADEYFSFVLQAGPGLYITNTAYGDYSTSGTSFDLGFAVNAGLNMNLVSILPGYKYLETWNEETVHWFSISVALNLNAPP